MAGLLDFSGENTTLQPVYREADPTPGGGAGFLPSDIVYPNSNISGAVTGVVNGLSRSVEAYFNQLPVQLGIAAPAPMSPLGAFGGAGGMSLGMLALIGVGVYLLASRR